MTKTKEVADTVYGIQIKQIIMIGQMKKTDEGRIVGEDTVISALQNSS